MWRHFARLPLQNRSNVVSLGEGDTPLVALERISARLGRPQVWLKAEHLNPTGSFKDRIASVALSIAVERALRGCIGTSSGNGGAAAAAYSARAGLAAHLFALSDTVELKLLQIVCLGASVHLVEGLGHDAKGTRRAAELIAGIGAEQGFFPMLTGGRYSPEAMDGAKTVAYELAEANPHLTAVYVPVGGGGLLAAIGRGYAEIAVSLPGPRPRLVAVQPAGCPTLGRALRGEPGELVEPTSTAISGLQVAALFDEAGAVSAVRDTGGHVVEIDDEAVWAAQAELAEVEGILVEPAGATAWAGVLEDLRVGRLAAGDRVAIIATGAGFKDVAALRRMATADVRTPRIGVEQIAEVMAAAASGRP